MNDKWPSTGRSVFLPMNQRGHVPWLTEGGQSDTVWFLCHLSVHVSLSPPFKIHAAHRPSPAPPWELFHSKSGYLKLPQRRDHLEKPTERWKDMPKEGWLGRPLHCWLFSLKPQTLVEQRQTTPRWASSTQIFSTMQSFGVFVTQPLQLKQSKLKIRYNHC